MMGVDKLLQSMTEGGVRAGDQVEASLLYVYNAYTTYSWMHGLVCLFGFYVLSTSNIVSGRVPTCVRMPSWQLYSAAPQGEQTEDIS